MRGTAAFQKERTEELIKKTDKEWLERQVENWKGQLSGYLGEKRLKRIGDIVLNIEVSSKMRTD